MLVYFRYQSSSICGYASADFSPSILFGMETSVVILITFSLQTSWNIVDTFEYALTSCRLCRHFLLLPDIVCSTVYVLHINGAVRNE